MQMVSAAKMRKAQNAAMASRTYASLAWELIFSLTGGRHIASPLLETYPDATKIGVVLITTNGGLVGGLNSNLLQKLAALEKEGPLELFVVGKKGREASVRLQKHIVAEFTKSDSNVQVKDVYALAKLLSESYASGTFKKIVLLFNHFVSTLVQKPTQKQLFPLIAEQDETATKTDPGTLQYLYEPGPEQVLKELLPRIIESQLYQAFLESDASEHSARMIMMKNATESAGDLIDDLTLTFNQLRQGKITTELSEITAGRIALEK
jgi:F-type H+-transporting ATPase subunit gamma